ncbi:MAG TPA: histidine phosphatase family protein [Clostridiaceae bacterium]|nr:histidine phosphatase family protein [Clostridiaceae bacterium]
MNAKIHIIRHGRTFANEKSLYCGSTDIPLSESGAKEILDFKSKGVYPKAELFITSGMKRTIETLKLIYGDVDFITIKGLREYDFGDFEMQGYNELKDRPDYQEWITDEEGNVRCPGGESKNEFYKRVDQSIQKILKEIFKRDTGSAMVICHGGVIAVIMDRLFPNKRNFYEWQPKYGLGYTLEYSNGEFKGYKNIEPTSIEPTSEETTSKHENI